MAISPTVRRRRLGSEIKRLRDAERVSGSTLAKKIGTSQPQLSRVENARGQLSAAQLEKLIKVFGVDERKAEEMRTLRRDGDVLGWWEQYSDVMPDNVELLIGLEAEAAWEQTYQDAFIRPCSRRPGTPGPSSARPHPSSTRPTCPGSCNCAPTASNG